MGVAHVDPAGPLLGEGRRPVGPEAGRAHVHRRPVARSAPADITGPVLDGAHPGQGGHREGGRRHQPGAHGRLGQTPHPVARSSRRCSRRRWCRSMVRSARLGAGQDPDHPVGADPEPPVAQGPDQPRRRGRSGRPDPPGPGSRCRRRGAWSGRSGGGCRGGRQSSSLLAILPPGPRRPRGPFADACGRSHPPPPDRPSGSNHTIRGSRRNQARCRRAKVRVRWTARSTASARGSPSSRWARSSR